jgi:hypothetical protein
MMIHTSLFEKEINLLGNKNMASHIQDEQEERAWPADLKRRKFKDSLVENLQEY